METEQLHPGLRITPCPGPPWASDYSIFSAFMTGNGQPPNANHLADAQKQMFLPVMVSFPSSRQDLETFPGPMN